MAYKLFLINIIALYIISCTASIHEIAYYDNGNKRYDIEYKNGNIDGLAIYWDDDGNLINKVYYINNKLHGQWIDYYSNGNILHTIKYNFGKKHGTEIWYYESGNIKSQVVFKNDNIVSDIIRWDDNGKIIYE